MCQTGGEADGLLMGKEALLGLCDEDDATYLGVKYLCVEVRRGEVRGEISVPE